MKDKKTYSVLKIRKRPWYIWILRLIWIAWLVFWIEVAVGSRLELEPKAFTISIIIFAISLFLGFLLWLKGLRKFRVTSQ